MACPGEALIDPIRGQRITFRRTATETRGVSLSIPEDV